jgi:hypothetical protein
MKSHYDVAGDWESLYTAALLERDRGKFGPKAEAAQAAISERLRELPSDIEQSREQKALLEALHNIQVLIAQEADPRRIPV